MPRSDTHAQWWLWDGQHATGPYKSAAVASQLLDGTVSPDTQAMPVGNERWQALRDWKVFPLPQSPAAVLPVSLASASQPDEWWAKAPQWLAYLIIPAIVFVLLGVRHIGKSFSATPQQRALTKLRADAVRDLDAGKQTIFDQTHPVGTARSVDVHDVRFAAGAGGETLIVYRFTLHWEGPVSRDGFTKLQVAFDPESQAVMDWQILATNGVTHAQAQQMAFDFGQLIGQAAREEQERRRHAELMERLRGS